MAKYRCKACGAPHKEEVHQCRQCGAQMDPPIVAFTTHGTDQSMSTERFGRRSMLPLMLVGLGVGLVIVIGAIALGFGQGTSQIDWVRRHLPFLGDTEDDWVTFTAPGEVFLVEMPSDPSEGEEVLTLTENGETSWWTAPIGDDFELSAGHSEGAELEEDDPLTTLDAGLAEVEASIDGTIIEESGAPFGWYGYPAVDAVIDGADLPKGPAYLSIRLVLVDGELVFAQTVSYQENPGEHGRLRDSLLVGEAVAEARADDAE